MNQNYPIKTCQYCQFSSMHSAKLNLTTIKRSKGVCLHNLKGIQFIDFHLEDASLLLGHAHPYLTRQIKNTISKGYIYPAPDKLFNQLKKRIQQSYPKFEHINFFHSFHHLVQEMAYPKNSEDQKILFFGSQYQTHWYPYLKGIKNVTIINSNNIQELDMDKNINILCLPSINLYPYLQEYDTDFWQRIHQQCTANNIQLVIDNSIQGLHYSSSIAEQYADGIILGKQLANGLPLYSLLHKTKDYQNTISSYFSPSYNAAVHMQNYMQRHQCLKTLTQLSKWFKQNAQKKNLPIAVHGSMLFLNPNLEQRHIDTLHQHFLKHRIFTNPWHPQLCFLSTEHTKQHLSQLLDAYTCFLQSNINV